MSAVTKPVRLAYRDEKGRLRMNEEAASILLLVKGPIGVVSVCGPAQLGKSYISNQLMGRTSGFEVGRRPYNPDHCTEGLWMWFSPSTKTADDGTNYNILVIDTEGSDSPYGEKCLYLAVVLSSMLIYNQMGDIDGTSFHYVSVVTKMVNTMAGDITASEFKQFFPMFFVWLLRDFTLCLGEMTPCEYMDDFALKPLDVCECPEDVKYVNELNKVKTSIKDLFVGRHCFIFHRPSLEEKKLLILDKVPVRCLRKEFREGVKELRSLIFEKTKPKKIGATVVTGPIFVQITRYVIDALNNGKRPTIACILEHVEKTKRPKALKSATIATVFDDPPAANTRQRKRMLS
ncbi:unnamed protein product [Lactuca virosa]|uniref:GB1/RHD3-type G domain-containing protein n=1 Tax=Lactuca virosa TaxID=75947 RepID=A0AAU9MJ75_9ASTR|nr:unnamed protein product [Lactuca virosa]